MVVLDATIVNIALPDIKNALGFSSTGLSWVINAYTLAFGGLLLLGARAGDILGRRRVFLVGIGLFTLASMSGGVAASSTELLIARALQGVGGALAAPSALALLMTLFPEARERTKALGWYTAVSIGGSAVGLIVGGMLTQWVSWRWVLFINVPIGIALLLVALRVVPQTERHPGKFDLTGALTSTLGMGTLVYSLVRAASDGWGDPLTLTGFAVSVILLAAFVAVEVRASSPITPLRLFADRNRATSYIARLLLVAGMFGVFFFLTQFLQDILGYSPVVTGLAFLPLTVALFIASQASARVLTRQFGEKPVLVAGLLTSTVGLFLLTTLSADSSYLHLLLPLLLFGIGNGLAFVPLTSLSLAGVKPQDAGAGSGLVNVTQQVGGAMGLAVLITVFAHAAGPNVNAASAARAAGRRPSAAAIDSAHQAYILGADRAFGWAAAFLAAAAIVVFVLVRRAPEQASDVEAGQRSLDANRSGTSENFDEDDEAYIDGELLVAADEGSVPGPAVA
jgi:EmrB/QacA subfamily drug resistance transporter